MPAQQKPDLSHIHAPLKKQLTDLIGAAELGFTTTVKRIIQLIARPHTETDSKHFDDVLLYVLLLAADQGHADLLTLIISQPIQSYEGKRAQFFIQALESAVEQGHEPVMLLLIQHEAIPIATIGNKLLRIAADHHQAAIVDRLLRIPKVLNYADLHSQIFAHYLHPFITRRVTHLQARQQRFTDEHPHETFNIRADEIPFYFYVLKHLIRRNDEHLMPSIDLLLSIPILTQQLHLSIEQTRRNELFRLANSIPNIPASTALLTLPNVLAEANLYHFYPQDTVDDPLGLRRQAGFRESSMSPLNQSEERIIRSVVAHYQNTAQGIRGVHDIINGLKAHLRRCYEENPIIFTCSNGQIHRLPLEISEFFQMSVSAQVTIQDQTIAIHNYFQHSLHTAYRYLSKPNLLIDPTATHIARNEYGRYALFEPFIPLIAYFWLAASDPNIPPTEGQTIPGRQTFFINSLALIGRAHNWDRTRYRLNPDGTPMRNANGQPMTEEFDDLRFDNPSCIPGTQRRLFEAVTGHLLFEYLSLSRLQQELYGFIHDFFKERFLQKTPTQQTAIRQAIAQVFILTEQPAPVLLELNISLHQKQSWIVSFSTKYGAEFDENPQFLSFIYQKLNLPSDEAHITRFYTSCGLNTFLEPLPDANDSEMLPVREPTPSEAPLVNCNSLRRDRFNMLLAPGVTTLNLNTTGLSELTPVAMNTLFRQLAYLPNTVTSISFSSNGFQTTNPITQTAYLAFINALSFIPSTITSIDLSGNGFESHDPASLGALLSSLPNTIQQVSLTENEALTPAQLLAKPTWPQSYYDLTKTARNAQDTKEIARLLLDDYTKGGNAVRRFFSGHWNRHHVGKVHKIVGKMTDENSPISLKEAIKELRLISKESTGSLAKRLHFIEIMHDRYPGAIAPASHLSVESPSEPRL